jgi:AraC-like DNA-binding protein/NAD(P)H-dependent FMN reductase
VPLGGEDVLTEHNGGRPFVLLMNGSQAEPSRSRALLDTTADVMATMGAEPVRWYADRGDSSEPAHGQLRELANAAAAVVLVTPVYHNSFSGALKGALDHLNAGHLAGKPVALMSTGGTYNCQAIDQLRTVVGAMRGVVVPTHLIATDADFAYLVDGYQLTGSKLRSRLVDLIEELNWFIGRLRDRPGADEAPAAVRRKDSPGADTEWKDVAMSAPRPWNGQLSESITRAVAYIRDNYDDSELTLDTVAREVHISRFHFSRSFKAQTGRRFIDYLTMLRLSRARTLLAETENTVTGICHSVGYRDLSHFERTFKGWFALSPSEFRRRQRTSAAERPAPAAPQRTLPAALRRPDPMPIRSEPLASFRGPA